MAVAEKFVSALAKLEGCKGIPFYQDAVEDWKHAFAMLALSVTDRP